MNGLGTHICLFQFSELFSSYYMHYVFSSFKFLPVSHFKLGQQGHTHKKYLPYYAFPADSSNLSTCTKWTDFM